MMSQNRRNRRVKNKKGKTTVNINYKKDKTLGIITMVTVFIAVLAIFFYEVVFYFFYLLFN
ncbi:hypothetical protein DHD08_05225 [Arenibacter sp. H213]|nr:hypothetical protein [Arenibacter sp. H213]